MAEIFRTTEGKLYAATSGVTTSSTEVAEFSGNLILSVSYSRAERRAQERFQSDAFFSNAQSFLQVGHIAFNLAALDLLWDVTLNASDMLADGSTASTSYQITNETVPNSLELLFHANKFVESNYTPKELEILAPNAVCPQIQIYIPKRRIVLTDCIFELRADTSGNVVKVSEEN